MTPISKLQRLFTVSRPLGPVFVDHPFDPEVLKQIFQTSVHPYESEAPEASTYIFGRRGSGKTTLLFASTDFAARPSVELYESDVLTGMRDLLASLERRITVSLDAAAHVWACCFYLAAATYLAWEPDPHEGIPERIQLSEFIAALERSQGYKLSTPTEVLAAFFDEVLVRASTDHIRGTFSGWLDRLEFGAVGVRDVREHVDAILGRRNVKVEILIDALEELTRRPEHYAVALRPLFSFLGKQAVRPAVGGLHVRCCLPTELTHELRSLSENPHKDFLGICYLQWSTEDLTRLVVSRLAILGDVLTTLGDDALARRIADGSETPRAMLEQFLPPKVRNLCGIDENTYPYMFRHTQLLPRQVLLLFSRLFGGEDRVRRLASGETMTESQVIDAVRQSEVDLAQEVLNAHRYAFRSADIVLQKLIPNLPSRFTLNDLERWYDELSLRPHVRDFEDLRSLVLQIGVVGRVERETEWYVRGEFAYTIPSGLNPGEDEELCLHPMFSRYMHRRPSARKPIYPAASRIEDEPLHW